MIYITRDCRERALSQATRAAGALAVLALFS